MQHGRAPLVAGEARPRNGAQLSASAGYDVAHLLRSRTFLSDNRTELQSRQGASSVAASVLRVEIRRTPEPVRMQRRALERRPERALSDDTER